MTAPVYEPGIKAAWYEIPSRSEPGTRRTVRLNPYTRRPTSCDCPARRTCWHMQYVEAGADGLKVHIRYGPRPVFDRAARQRALVSDLWA